MERHVIDIQNYLGVESRGDDGRAFSVWGGEGGRTRFALPVWRAIQLVGGERGGIVSVPKKETVANPLPFFLLDLRKDPAEVAFPTATLERLRTADPPALEFTGLGELAVLLGEEEERVWFIQVLGGRGGGVLDEKAREILLFLAGECAGLLFFRELAR